MSFKEITDLNAQTCISLGGLNSKTDQPNPKQAEGYFLGTRQVQSKLSQSGFANIHFLQTAEGNLGVWGKAELDRKLQSVDPGTMVRLTFTGTQKSAKGKMYTFKVEQDKTNTIEVNSPVATNTVSAQDDEPETEFDSDETPNPTAYKTQAPKSPAQMPDADRQARVRAALAGRGNAS